MNHLKILWQPVNEGCRILEVFGNHSEVRIPDIINGLPVTEIGPYCFAETKREISGEYFTLFSNAAKTGEYFPLRGKSVEKIILPASVRTLHNAAFYNCRKLHTLSVGNEICAIGSDEFTNCGHLTKLIYRGHPSFVPGLSLILERIETDLNVIFTTDAEAQIQGALFFPEYYEWLDEISPAHIFSRSIHGEGFRMRKSIQENQVDYHKYDSCFENACRIESERVLCRIALNRLRWPDSLGVDFRASYESILQKHFETAVSLAVTERDFALLSYLFTECSLNTISFTLATQQAIDAGWGEGAAFLMDAQNKHRKAIPKDFSFDDF